ncbi:MAG: NAD(P)/FAD-dependent oxidoreductase [archaeon]
MTYYDSIIVGAGPAGMFAAYELVKKSPGCKVLLIDKGNLIENRKKTEIMNGFGGAGTFSDGKLHFTPVLSHEKMFHLLSKEEYQVLLDYSEKIFLDFGVPPEYYPKTTEKTQQLVEEAKKNNIMLYVRKTIHVGTDRLPKIMNAFQEHLQKNGVEILPKTDIADLIIKDNKVLGVLTNFGEEILGSTVICAPGRYNAKWMQEIAKKYKLEEYYDKIEVGVRAEFPSEVLKKHAEELYETIFTMYTPTYDDLVRTFCPCPRGHVGIEEYEGFTCVNGYSNSDHDSKNSNFALVTEVALTEPLESTRAYAHFIAQGTNLLGAGKPIVQRLKDLKKGRRSTKERIAKAHIFPSLPEAVPGDIGMSMPYRVVKNLLEGIEMLDKILPGLNADSTLLYAPEVKFRSNKIMTNKELMTSINGLYVAGDGAGVAGNIVGAAITGIVAARGISSNIEAQKVNKIAK